MTSEEESLPPELEAAFAQRRAEAELEMPGSMVSAGDDHRDVSPEEHDVEVAKRRGGSLRSRSLLHAFAVLPLAVGIAAAFAWSGIAGWRGGPLIATVALVGTTVPIAAWMTHGLPWRPAYVGGAALIALAGVAVSVDVAPLSHGRLEQKLDRVTFPFAEARTAARSGHGWCTPTCPTLVRELSVEGRPASALYKTAVVALDTAGFVPKDGRRTFLGRALSYDQLRRGAVIDHQSFTTVVRLRNDGDTGVIRIEVTSRRGFREQPDPPRPLSA